MYPHLLGQVVPGNPDKLSAETLHRQAWPIIEPYFLRGREEAAARYRDYAGTRRASCTARKLVPAAYHGRVERLFIAIDQELWGTFHPTTNMVHVHCQARYQDKALPPLTLCACIVVFKQGMNLVLESKFFEQFKCSFSDRIQLGIEYLESRPGFTQAGDGRSQSIQVF